MREGFVRLGDVCSISGGYTPKPSQLFPEGDIPYFKVADMNRIGNEISLCYTDQYLKEARKAFPKGAIVFPKNGGAVATNKKRILAHDAVVDLNTGIAIPRESVDNQYLFYYFQGIDFKSFIKEGTLPVLRTKEIANLPFYFPSLTEQQRIVDILAREFAKIDALKANAEKSLQAAKDLFLQILTETFSNPDWTRKRIGDVFDTGAGGTPLKTYKEYYENGDIPWLRSGEVCKKYITETELFITQLGMDNSSAKMFPENSVVVAMYGATAGQVGILHLETTTNQAVCGIFPRKDYIPEFVYYSLLNSKKGLVAQATGNAQPNISQIKIKNTTIPVISKDKQVAVVSRLDDLNDLCNALQQNYQKTLTLCDDLKQSLLRKAFNGEL